MWFKLPSFSLGSFIPMFKLITYSYIHYNYHVVYRMHLRVTKDSKFGSHDWLHPEGTWHIEQFVSVRVFGDEIRRGLCWMRK